MIEVHSITCTSGGSHVSVESDVQSIDGGITVEIALDPELPGRTSLDRLEISFRFDEPPLGCFKNGFQSWSTSGEYSPCERETLLSSPARLLKLHRFGDDHFLHSSLRECSRRRGLFLSHVYTFVRHSPDRILLAGSIDESSGYTFFLVDLSEKTLTVSKDVEGGIFSPGELLLSLLLRWGAEGECFTDYWKTLEDRSIRAASRVRLPTGWTSWYNYYTEIDENIILENLEALENSRVPLDYFQIDDGYQEAVGDWLRIRDVFPRGMHHLAGRARAAGFIPGLWLAPFICERRSALAREHPEWILTDERGRRVPAGWNPGWSGTFYALDTENQEFLAYLRGVFETVFDGWGFEMVKLDFLYAAGMIPRNGRTRGQIMYGAMDFLRSCAGKRIVLGCGVPLGAAFFKTDICRISSDAALKWEDRLLRRLRYPERVSTVNCLTSTLGRRQMGMSWAAGKETGTEKAASPAPARLPFLTDPDVVILRSRGVDLAPAEGYTLFLMNALFGQVLFTSDDVSRYTPQEGELFLSLFPFREKQFESVRSAGGVTAAVFFVDGKRYRAYANLSGRRVRFFLPPPHPAASRSGGGYFRSRNTEGRLNPVFVSGGEPIELAGRESACFLELPDEVPSIAGTTGNLFPGSEITDLEGLSSASERRISFDYLPSSRSRGEVFIRVPGHQSYTVNGTVLDAYEALPGTWIVRTGS